MMCVQPDSTGYPFKRISMANILKRVLPILGSQQFTEYRSIDARALLMNTAKTLYVDDLAENDNFVVTSFNSSSKLMNRIVKDLLC